MADPPGELTYGEALTALKLAALAVPSVWPLAAAALEEAIQCDASVVETIARGATTDQARIAIQEQGTALVCADSPARQPASAWPRVVDRLEAVSRIGGPVVGWLNATCASWPTQSANRLEQDRELHALALDLFRGAPRPAGPSRNQMLQALAA